MSTSSSPSSESLTESFASAELLWREVRAGWQPPERLSVPAWADEYRKLAVGFGATSGDWETSYVEVARGPMLAVTEPGVRTITVMVATQLLKTELLLNTWGYFAHIDPCPSLFLQPKDDAADQFSKERLQPMIAATPVLRARIGGPEETLKYKPFPGGFGAIAGAGSADNVARRPVRLVLADEINKYRPTKEGDTLLLVGERTATFGLNSLEIRACSPTVEDECAISASYAKSDQRRATLECPHCQHRMFPAFFKHVQWEKDAAGGHLPETACICCEACGAAWSEGDRLMALQTARWHQTRPFDCCGKRQVPLDAYESAWKQADRPALVDQVWDWWCDADEGRYAVYRAKCSECGHWPVGNKHAGFQAGKLFSPSQKDKPSDQAAKWLDAKGNADSELSWWNTQQGLPHRPLAGKVLAVDTLLTRREVFEAEVPFGVAALTVGIDTQDYRVELETVGWGRDEESWSIDYHVIEGEFSDPQVQAAVDAYLKRLWRRADGRTFEVIAACQDSGGHHTQAVYNFCKARLGRRIWAIKGASERDGQRNPVWPTKKPTKRTKASYRPTVIGGNAARDIIRSRLLLEVPPVGQPAPGYAHFPVDRDVAYFQQLTADRLMLKEVGKRKVRIWDTPAGKANEAADCRVYAYAALCGLIHFGLQLNKRASAMEISSAYHELPPAAEPVLSPGDANQVPPAARIAAGPAPTKPKSLISRIA